MYLVASICLPIYPIQDTRLGVWSSFRVGNEHQLHESLIPGYMWHRSIDSFRIYWTYQDPNIKINEDRLQNNVSRLQHQFRGIPHKGKISQSQTRTPTLAVSNQQRLLPTGGYNA